MAIFGLSPYGPPEVYGIDLPPDYLVDPFIAASIDYGRILITWKKPSGTIFQYRLLKNRFGFPVNENDGDILLDSGHDNAAYFGNQFIDQNIIQGTYHYYAVYVLVSIGDNIWIRGGVTACLATSEMGSAKMMWSLIPEHFRTQLDGGELTTDMAGNIYLQQFLLVLGWGMDYLRTQYWYIANYLNDPRAMPVNDLYRFTSELGLNFSPEVPAYTMRKAAANMTTVSRQRGTLVGLRNEVVIRTSWDADITIGPNFLLHDDQSQFLSNIEEYHPARYYMTKEIVAVYYDHDTHERWDWDDHEHERRTWCYDSRYRPGKNWEVRCYVSLVNNNRYDFPGTWGTDDSHWHCCRDEDDVYFKMLQVETTVPSTWEVVDSTATGGIPATGSGTLGNGVMHPLSPTNDTSCTSFRLKNKSGNATNKFWARSVARRTVALGNIIDPGFEKGITLPGRHHSRPDWCPDDWPRTYWEPDRSWDWWPNDWWRGPYHNPSYWTHNHCTITRTNAYANGGTHSAMVVPHGLTVASTNAQVQAQAQLADAGFETSVAGWTVSGSNAVSQASSMHHTGSHSLEVGVTSSPFTLTGPKVAIQTGTLLPATITASLWARTYTGGYTTNVSLALQFYTAGNVAIGAPVSGTTMNNIGTSWANPTVTAVAPSNATQAALVVTASQSSLDYLEIDDILFSAVLPGTAAPTLPVCNTSSPWATCPAGTAVTGSIYIQPAGTLTTTMFLSLQWFDRWGTLISATAGSATTPAAGSFTQKTVSGTAPASTRYVALQVSYTAAQITDVTYLDGANLAVSIPQPATFPVEPTVAIEDGLPVPWIRPSQQWSPTTRYGTGAIVLYQDQPFVALRASTGALPPTNCVPTPEWAPLSENQRIRLAISAYTSQNLTVVANTTCGVIPFVEWFDKHGNWIARIFARNPDSGGALGKPDKLVFDSFTGMSVVAGSGGSGSITFGPWAGSYYANTTLSGSPTLTRTDASLSSLWTSGASPGTGIPTSGWSASWDNSFTPATTGTYTFALSQAGGGARIIVNGTTIVDDWSGSGATSGTVTLYAGSPVSVTVQYYNNAAVAAGWGANLLSGFNNSYSWGHNTNDYKYDNSSLVSVVSGQPFRFSTNAAGDSSSVKIFLWATINWVNASGTTIGTSVTNSWNSNTWETNVLSVSGTVPAGATQAYVTITIYDNDELYDDDASYSGTNFQQNLPATGGSSSLSLSAPTYTSTGAYNNTSTLSGRITDDHNATWTTPVGNFNVGQFAGGTCWPSVQTSPAMALVAGPANTNVAVTFRSPAISPLNQGLIFRATDSTHYWIATSTVLMKNNGGTWTTVGTFSTSFSPGDRMMVTLSGSTINVYRNAPGTVPAVPGTMLVLGPITDAFNSTATLYGMAVQ